MLACLPPGRGTGTLRNITNDLITAARSSAVAAGLGKPPPTSCFADTRDGGSSYRNPKGDGSLGKRFLRHRRGRWPSHGGSLNLTTTSAAGDRPAHSPHRVPTSRPRNVFCANTLWVSSPKNLALSPLPGIARTCQRFPNPTPNFLFYWRFGCVADRRQSVCI